MSNLESIVPPLELCKQIPEGCFEDSALVWWGACVYPRIYPDGVRYGKPWHKRGTIPAPTLEEILARLPRSVEVERVSDDQYPDEWGVYCRELYKLLHGQSLNVSRGRADERAVNAAMKLWLELNKE